ncbi:matrix metalloproteinase-23-like [Pelodiscus sinensis]|uniref:matrix metalloproteinase-23-like n=1 Tax=Pelodiscus sinensis TaxID=13735 RepID=UPI003F6BD253
MKRHCPQICNSCSEFPAASPSVRVQPPHIHTKYLSKGRAITFRCGLNTSRTHLQISWYKDGVLLSRSVPGLELLPSQALRVHAAVFSEGQYTCLVRRASRVLRANSWQLKLKARGSSPHKQPGQPDVQGIARA